MAACTNYMMKVSKGVGKLNKDTWDWIIFNILFDSKRYSESEDVGSGLIMIVKNIIKGFCKL